MTLRAHGNKRDKSEAAIVETLRKAGCSVYRLDKPCDLIILYRGAVHLVEVKSGRRGKLTEAQDAFRAIWPLYIIRDVDGALEALRQWSALRSPAMTEKAKAA